MTTDGRPPQSRSTAEAAAREQRFCWLLDTSASMQQDARILALNQALRKIAPVIRESAARQEDRDLIVHAIQFADDARWISEHFRVGVPGRKFDWPTDMVAEGMTSIGAALELLATGITVVPGDTFPPAACLITDGQSSDDLETGLGKFLESAWGASPFRLAIAVGDDADRAACARFSSPNCEVVAIDRIDDLAVSTMEDFFHYVETTSVGEARRHFFHGRRRVKKPPELPFFFNLDWP